MAKATGLSLPTIKRVESERDVSVSADALAVIQRALEAAGVEFTNGGSPGVRMRAGYQPPPPAKPEFDPFGGKGGIQTQVGEPRRPRPRKEDE